MAKKLTSPDAAVALLLRYGCPWRRASEFRRMAAARMKAIFSVIFVAGGLLLLASPVVFYYPIHDRLGL